MSALSNKDIKEEITKGNIVIAGLLGDIDNYIGNCSVDVTLGEYFFKNEVEMEVFNPWCKEHVIKYWGQAKTASVVTEETSKQLTLEVGKKYILLHPGETILGHTNEFIGGRHCVTTMMKARSSLGRCNVTVCRDAGWGDINFYNRWCLEITNEGKFPTVIPFGCRIGQVVFFRTGECDKPYNGKYHPNNNDSLETTIANWVPDMLLPQLWKEEIY